MSQKAYGHHEMKPNSQSQNSGKSSFSIRLSYQNVRNMCAPNGAIVALPLALPPNSTGSNTLNAHCDIFTTIMVRTNLYKFTTPY